MSKRSVLSLLLVAVYWGCSGPQIATGPYFEWSGRPESQSSDQFPLKFIDQRPDWEQVYRVPSTDCSEYEWGIGFIPLENFVPEIPDTMEHSVRNCLQSLDTRYAFGDVTLNSFRVVIDRREILKQKFDAEVRRARARVWSDQEIPEPALIPSLRFEGTRRLLVGPPRELKNSYSHYGPGVICELEATVGMHRAADGGREEFQIRAVGTAPEWPNAARARGWQSASVSPTVLNLAVQEALEGFESHLNRELHE